MTLEVVGARYCPYCGSADMIRFGLYKYKDQIKQRYYCKSCKGITISPARRKPKRRRRY